MAGFTVIGDVGIELRRQLFDTLDSATELAFPVTTPAATVLLGPPDAADAGGSALASLYLHHVAPSRHRNQGPLPDPVDPALFRRPPAVLTLRYLLTPLGSDEPANHALIGRVIQHFLDQPSFTTLSSVPIGGGYDELRVSIDALTLEQLAQLWSAFNTPYRLSIGLQVELVAVDSALPARRTPRTAETVVLTELRT